MRKIFSLVLALVAATTLAFAAQETVNCGTTVKIQANPNTHYHFVRWSDNITDNPRYVEVNATTELQAIFAADDTYTLSVGVNAGAEGQVNIVTGAESGNYEGAAYRVEAVATGCGEFLYWEDDHTNTNPVREGVFGTTNLNFVAVFGVKSLNITITAGEGGSVQFVTE